MNYLKKEKRNVLDIIVIIFTSLIVIGIISKGNLNYGLYDDNQTQWLPVIDKAYQTLFQTGKLPTIDFLQMKGMKIYDQGYYGLWNPFMLSAYILRTYLLSFLNTNTITVYIVIMTILGNICSYKIFREYEVNRYQAILLSSVLLSASVYIAFIYWYYIYNVYFILTWLIFRIIKNQKSKSYYEYGAILALSLLMGNIQYTVYMYLAFLLIMIILFWQGEKRALGKLVSNTICMGFLSAFHLLLLLGASLRSVDFSGSSSGYYSNTVHPILMAIFSWIPASFFGETAENLGNVIYTKIPLPEVYNCPEIRSMYMGAGVAAVVLFLWKKRKNLKDRFDKIALAGIATAFVLLVLSFGKVGILAIFMEQIPFLNSFRILLKYLVLLPPLLLPCTACVLRKNKSFCDKTFLFLFFFMVFGLIQNRYISFGALPIQTQESVERLQTLDVDYHNYRIAGFASYDEIRLEYPQWEDFEKREKISLEEKFSKNAGTMAGVITIGGYDLSFDYEQFQTSESLMGTVSGYASEFGYDNMIIEDYFFARYNRESPEYWVNIGNLKQQIQENGVKYFIFSKDSSGIAAFLQMLQDMQIEIEWQQPFMENTEMISICGVTPVVSNAKGEKIEADISLDKITFASENNQNFRVGMYYDKNLKAFSTDSSGNRKAMSLLPDEKGYIIVSGTENMKNERIEIYYDNKWYSIGQVWSITVLLLIAFILVMPEMVWVRKFVCLLEKRIRHLLGSISSIQPQKGVWICFAVLLCGYICFLGFYYLHIKCTVPDEEWFMQISKTIHHMAEKNFFVYFAETENYLGYGQIYWIISSMFPNMYILRIAALVMLMGSMFLTLREVKIRFGAQMVPYAGILWISMPFAWYSDKIIGPELLGFFLGILGLSLLNSKKRETIGWIVLGISCAVKMNYVVFAMAAVLLAVKRQKDKKILMLFKAGTAGLGGVVIGNPIILWDLQTYLANAQVKSQIYLSQLSYVFTKREREWDGVMTNGVFWGYVSVFLLFVLLIGWGARIFQKTNSRLAPIRRENRYYSKCLIMISILLIVICCRDFFLGWYLLPLSYFVILIVCELFDFRGKTTTYKNLYQWAFIICLLINAMILLPEHLSIRTNNIAHMQMMAKQESIKELIEGEQNPMDSEVQWYNLLDFHMEEYSYNFEDYVNFCFGNQKGIAIIGDRMRAVTRVNEIIQQAINEEEGLHVLKHEKDVWFIQRD